MYCKRIRDDDDYWQQVENYLHTHTGSNFSHGICPACLEREFGASPHSRTKLNVERLAEDFIATQSEG
jgi:hypothetical protein